MPTWEKLMYNKSIVYGRLYQDPLLRQTKKGDAVTYFTLVVKEDGEQTEFVDCVAYGQTAELIAKYQRKDSLVLVDGKITSFLKEDNGKKSKVTRVKVNDIKYEQTTYALEHDAHEIEETNEYDQEEYSSDPTSSYGMDM